ncbi:MAG: rRNA maturation RNase YbeY [Pricia sp.]|nr:rRNA maturation RNase YbeY [Pricia sp.]
MIEIHYETQFKLENESKFTDWITRIIESENCHPGRLTYIFCDDTYLLHLNQKFLSHDTYTDIISFDYSEGNDISGDVFISIDRVRENSAQLNTEFLIELLRVMSHGVLHLLGYKDKSKEERMEMRAKENEKMKMFHVEQ